jgi:hypothetical protein
MILPLGLPLFFLANLSWPVEAKPPAPELTNLALLAAAYGVLALRVTHNGAEMTRERRAVH